MRKIGYQRTMLRADDDTILCSLDNTPIKDHPRCVVCSILIGERHHMRQAHTVDGKTICTECRQRLSTPHRVAGNS